MRVIFIKNKWTEVLADSLLFSDIDRKDIIQMMEPALAQRKNLSERENL